MFCPNCGTQNDDSLSTCQKCGFSLKGAAAPKFKGTMLMVNAPAAAPKPAGPGPAAPAPMPPMAPMGAPPAPAMGSGSLGGGPASAQAAGKPMMKATMIGVAPPSAGGVVPPSPGGFPAPQPMGHPQAPPPAMGPGPMGGAPGAAPYGAPQYGAPQPMGAPPAPAPMPGQPGEHVNPLAGTFVADPAAVAGYMGPQAAQPPQPAYGQPAPVPQQAGAQPWQAQHGGPHQPAHQPGGPQPWQGGPQQGAPQQQGGPQPWQGGPQQGAPQQQGGVMGAFGSAAGAIQAAAPGGYPMGGPSGGGMSPGGFGPIGTVRNPVMVTVISCICFVYYIIALFGMLGELKAFRRKDDLNPIMFLVPVIQIMELLKLPEKVLDAKRMAGIPNPQVPSPILYFLLGIYFLPLDLNEIWQAASRQQGGALPPGPR